MLTEAKKIYYLKTAYGLAKGSPDPSTQLGALIVDPLGEVIGIGCNTFPRGVQKTAERLERPLKYNYIEHAERNAIFSALRNGSNTVGATMICPYIICHDCARAVIQSGITTLVGHSKANGNARWTDSINIGLIMLEEAGVAVEWIDADIGCSPILFNGEIFHP